MTKKNNNKELRECRSFDVFQTNNEADEYIAEGYLTTWEPYYWTTIGDEDYYEVIDRNAFDNCDFTDCCFRVDHEGTVYARTRNNTILDLHPDEHGMYCKLDLSKTAGAREKYEEIKSGMYDRMSHMFLASESYIDHETRTRHITRIDKLYDVSIVAFPANDGTSIEARSAFWDGVITEAKEAERLQEQKEKLKLKIKLMEM